jgi:hypothetical protein
MSQVGLNRASVFALTKEIESGQYYVPTSGSEFVPLRPGNTLNFEPEQLNSDELLNDIGAAKSFVGKENVSGAHSAYLRHSGVEGQEPELGVLYESIMGSKDIASTEFACVAGSTVGIIKVADGTQFVKGQSLLVKDASNGYSIRNVKEISGNDLILNFNLPDAPASGVNLGKAVSYLPVAQGHPTFSTTKYLGSGYAIEASAGNTVTELSLTADANGFGEVEFSYSGTKYFFNPIDVDGLTKYIDVTDDTGTFAVSVLEAIYKTPIELADALNTALNNASTETYSVTYNNQTGKFNISSGSTVLSLLWSTGANAANTIGEKIGFDISSDDTGSISYDSDNAQSYAPALTPSYDAADAIIIKGAELLIGNEVDNACVCAQTVSLSVSKEVQDVDCICEETGIKSKIATARTVEMSVTAVLNKYDAQLLDSLLKNKTIGAALNVGPKIGGNWAAGKCFNAYLESCTVSAYTTTGDSFIQAEFTLRGFVSTNTKDLYINFV